MKAMALSDLLCFELTFFILGFKRIFAVDKTYYVQTQRMQRMMAMTHRADEIRKRLAKKEYSRLDQSVPLFRRFPKKEAAVLGNDAGA